MDKRTILAFFLIGIILILSSYYQKLIMPPQPQTAQPQKQISPNKDTKTTEDEKEPLRDVVITVKKQEESSQPEKVIVVDTDLYRGVITSKGGLIKNWTLKKYKRKDGSALDLIADKNAPNLGVGFLSLDGDTVDLSNRTFEPVGSFDQDTTYLEFDGISTAELRLKCTLDEGKTVEKIMTFGKDKYPFDMTVKLEGLENIISDRKYWVSWGSNLTFSENKYQDEENYSEIYALMGDELESVNPKNGDRKVSTLTGTTRWIAVRIKYFTAAVIPDGFDAKGAVLAGSVNKAGKEVIGENFYGAIEAEFSEKRMQEDNYKILIGPLEYSLIKNFNVKLEKIMGFGWKFIRPIAKLIYYSLKYIYNYIHNYGWVIIIFSVFVKILLYPLTHSSYESMKKMSALQPQMAELREKYKKDPQKMQKATMRMYKEHGVNPLGGCLPMLLQMPILFAIYPVFYQMIEFRGAKFIWWINDLSVPDTVATLNLGFMTWNVNILMLIWVTTMFISSKLTMKDPKQKLMVYLMPVLMLFMLNNVFPSGLTLYWTVFNVLTTGQQLLIQRKKS